MRRSFWRKHRRRMRRRRVGPAVVLGAIFFGLLASGAALHFNGTIDLAGTLRGFWASSRVESVDYDSITLIEGDYVIESSGVRLEDTHVTGNLYLMPSIGSGSVDLVNVTVDGSILVRGGGLNSIYLLNCSVAEIKVNRPEGRVRLVASGGTIVETVELETGARLVENLAGEAPGFQNIAVLTADKVELSGSFNSVTVKAARANVEISSLALENLTVEATAADSLIACPDGMPISMMRLEGPAYLKGRLLVERTIISAPGLTELEGDFIQVRVTAEAGRLALESDGTCRELVFSSGAYNNSLHLDDDFIVAYLELNEAVNVGGGGIIEKVGVNATGSNMEQIPLDLEFMQDNLSIVIAGFNISTREMFIALRDHGDPYFSYPGEAPRETADSEREQTDVAETENAQEVPGDDDEIELSSTEGEGTTSSSSGESGSSAPPGAAEQGQAASGSSESGRAEELSANGLALLDRFIVDEGITPGKKMVIVLLTTDNPAAYEVRVGSQILEYSPTIEGFRGEVVEAEARREYLKIMP